MTMKHVVFIMIVTIWVGCAVASYFGGNWNIMYIAAILTLIILWLFADD